MKSSCAKWLFVALCAVIAIPERGAAQATHAVFGTVRDSAGTPVENVELEATPAGIRTRTERDGTYRLVGLLPGSVTITARRLGFLPVTRNLAVSAMSDRRLDLTLARTAEVLSALQVTAHQVYDSRLEGFNKRSQGQVGHFITRERIDRANSTTLSDVLREIPGIKIGGAFNSGRLIRLRSAKCPPLVFVDGFPASAGEFDVDMIDLKSVEGIEVYAGLGSIPPEFSGPRDLDQCGVIAIWYRPSRPTRSAPVEKSRSVSLPDTDEVRTVTEVDVPARPVGEAIAPQYPDSLLQSRIAGRVVVEAVIDTLGKVELASIDVLASPHELLTASVREALGSALFAPAMLKGRRVRQLAQLSFMFAPAPVRVPDKI